MTRSEANLIIRSYNSKQTHTEEDFFLFSEALQYLIDTNHDTDAMMMLGGEHYERKEFDLALKYYEMAESYGHAYACECLGYIWYYGRTGVKDYEKAFECFSKGRDLGSLVCAYKVADMYKNGYGVEKNYEKYKKIIFELGDIVDHDSSIMEFGPLPEIWSRRGNIYKEEGRIDDALNDFWPAKGFLRIRMEQTAFFGNFTIMRYLVKDIFSISPFDPSEEFFDIYDLYYLDDQPFVAHFDYVAHTYDIRCERQEDGTCAVEFQGKWYRSYDEFLKKGALKGRRLPEFKEDELVNWRVEY